ncbi:MAG: hypothetical protein V1748_01870 [Actinomycetota bacterium]
MKGSSEERSRRFRLGVFISVGAVLLALTTMIFVYFLNSMNADTNRQICRNNQRSLNTSIQQYLLDNNRDPTSLENLVGPGTNALKSIPECPSGSDSYTWVPSGPGGLPTVSCPNRKDHRLL